MDITLLPQILSVFVHRSDILGNEPFSTLSTNSGFLVVSHVLLEAAYRIRVFGTAVRILLALISRYIKFLLEDLLGVLVLPTW
jgi:hypothetical protein